MKKILIILLALIVFGVVLWSLFFYEKSLTSEKVFEPVSNNVLVKQEIPEDESEFLWEAIELATEATGVDADQDKNTIQEEIKNEETQKEPKLEIQELKTEEEKIPEVVIERKKWALYNDESIQKFVSPDVAFYELSYVPEELLAIESEYVIDTKGDARLRPEAIGALYRMAEVFYEEFETKISVVSTYRSYTYQKWIKDRGCSDAFCAKAWHSEHQSWLAIDLWEASSNSTFLANADYKKYFEWLQENAHRFGYHNSYQNGRAIDGYEKEPWHWRYVWPKLAWTLKNQGITLTEYYKLNDSDVVK